MSKRATYENNYPFYWLDEIIEHTLNPAKNNLQTITTELLQQITERLPGEIRDIAAKLKNQAFCLYCNEQVKVVAGHYDQAVRLLREQANTNLKQYPQTGLLRQTGQLILFSLTELAISLHHRYPDHLPEMDDMPSTLPATLFKLLIKMSGDQIGIFIRAAFEAELIDVNSRRAAYKALAPFLSTPLMEKLSNDSLRSNSGRPEEKDLDMLLGHLGRITEIVKSYYRRR